MRTETKWAIIMSIIPFIWMLIGKMLGLQTHENFSTWMLADVIAGTLLFIVIYYLVTREKREVDYGGMMTWSQGFWAAAIMTLIFVPLSALLIYIFIKFVSPDFAGIFAAHSGIDTYGKDPIGGYMLSHIMTAVFGGLLFSLLFPLFTKRSAK
jgi:uncharacterized membrane protein YhdT